MAKPTLKEAGQGKENLLNDLLSEILSIKLSKNYQVAHTKILISIENLWQNDLVNCSMILFHHFLDRFF